MRTLGVSEVTARVREAVQAINFHTPAPVLVQLNDVLANEPSEAGRLAMQDILVRELGGVSIDYTARVSESPWAVVHFTVRMPDSSRPQDVDTSVDNETRIQNLLTEAARTWGDRLMGAVKTGSIDQDPGRRQGSDQKHEQGGAHDIARPGLEAVVDGPAVHQHQTTRAHRASAHARQDHDQVAAARAGPAPIRCRKITKAAARPQPGQATVVSGGSVSRKPSPRGRGMPDASTSTCGVWVSRERTSSSMLFKLPEMSRAMSTFVRSSTAIEPRGESRSFERAWSSSACA